ALVAMARGDLPTPSSFASLVSPAGAPAPSVGVGAMADTAVICSCNNVTKGALREAIATGTHDVPSLKSCTGAGTGCGGCLALVNEQMQGEVTAGLRRHERPR